VGVVAASLQTVPAEAAVYLSDRYNNATGGPDVTAAEASAGDTRYDTLTIRNDSDLGCSRLRVWLDASTAGLAISDDAVSWVTPTTESAGLALGDLPAGQTAPLYLRRTISPSASYDPLVLNHLHYCFDGL